MFGTALSSQPHSASKEKSELPGISEMKKKPSQCNLRCTCWELFSACGLNSCFRSTEQSARRRLLKITRRQRNPHFFGDVRRTHALTCGSLRQLLLQAPVPRRTRYYRSCSEWLHCSCPNLPQQAASLRGFLLYLCCSERSCSGGLKAGGLPTQWPLHETHNTSQN